MQILKSTLQKRYNDNVYGFDIETYDRNKKFYCASLYHRQPERRITFFDRQDVIDHFKQRRFRHSVVMATNLMFDFFGTFYGTPEIQGFRLLSRGSHLISASTNIVNRNFEYDTRNYGKDIKFCDTLNYAMLSVKDLGELVSIKKLRKPACLGKKPRNKKERDYMAKYNMQDSRISCEASHFLFKSFYDMGANVKSTIASTAMSCFKNKYLEGTYFRNPVDKIREMFKAYYGGRTEAFSRGRIKNYNYYDVNSLYPYCMLKHQYPNPNKLITNHSGRLMFVKDFEGFSDVTVTAPNIKIPLLPFRRDVKLLFPVGTFRSWQTHVELRKALELGYSIDVIHKTHYFTETCNPFKEYVQDMYAERQRLIKKGSPVSVAVKILMNSLYGKFGQKFENLDEIQPFNHTLEELDRLTDFEPMGDDFIRIKRPYREPPAFTIPAWCAYVTAHARLELYDILTRADAVYCDTDSVITKKSFSKSKALGGLKLEDSIRHGFIVKPKFYSYESDKGEFSKIKGCSVKFSVDEFEKLLHNPVVKYKKFAKFREAMKRQLLPNQVMEVIKHMSLEDDKRNWKQKFNMNVLQGSEPVKIE